MELLKVYYVAQVQVVVVQAIAMGHKHVLQTHVIKIVNGVVVTPMFVRLVRLHV